MSFDSVALRAQAKLSREIAECLADPVSARKMRDDALKYERMADQVEKTEDALKF